MRGVSRTSFVSLRERLPEVLAESRRTRPARGRSASGATGTGQAGAATAATGAAASGRAPAAAWPRAGRRSRAKRPAAGAAGLAATVGDELFAVLGLLDHEHALRRALSDPSKPADEKGAIAVALLHGKVAPVTEELVAATVRSQLGQPIGHDRCDGAAGRGGVRHRGRGGPAAR